jgi:hypothetical protein
VIRDLVRILVSLLFVVWVILILYVSVYLPLSPSILYDV